MKKTKKIISLLLSILMIITALPLTAVNSFAADNEITRGDYTYVVLDDGTAKITKYTGKEAELIIPSEIDGYKVTELSGKFYFDECYSFVSYPKYVEKIVIPDSVTSIGNYAFYNCTSLTSITIPDSVTYIGYYAFYNCTSLTSITIPDGVGEIQSHTFHGCKSLTSVKIGSGVKRIEAYAFYGCSSLNLTIPDNVVILENNALSAASMDTLTLGKGITEIDVSALEGSCERLVVTSNISIAYHNGIIDTGIKILEIEKDVTDTNIGWDVDSLENINVSEENTVYSSIDGVLFNKDKTELIRYPASRKDTSYTVPDSVKAIGNRAFAGIYTGTLTGIWADRISPYLTTIILPKDLTSIGTFAFHGCTSLTSITIPDGVGEIQSHTFHGCKSLTSVKIGSGVKRIEAYAFYGCSSLNLTIPDNVVILENNALSGASMNTLTLGKGIRQIGSYALSNACERLILTGNIADVYSDSAYNIKTLEIEKDVTDINGNLFCNSLENINVSEENTVYSSIDGVLLNKDKTELIEYPNGRTDTSYTVPDSVKSIGGGAFAGFYYYSNYTSYLTTVTLPKGLTSIGDNAFSNCVSLTSITIPDSVTNIGSWAFCKCTSLTDITIPDSVISIAREAFAQCENLNSVTLGKGLTYIDYDAFYSCPFLNSVTIPQDCHLGGGAFGYIGGNPVSDFTIYGYTGSDAERYANENKFTFISIGTMHKPKSLSVSKLPDKTTYYPGENFEVNGLELLLTYTDGETRTLPVPENYWSNGYGIYWNTYSVGTSTVTVSYNGLETTFEINVVTPPYAFPDVSNDSWFYDAVKFNVEKGYLKGYGNGDFGPADNIQRQDFVVLLSRIAGADLSAYEGQNGGFADVPTGTYFSAAVAWAKDNNILSGYANGKFGVGDPITREQACVIFYNYCGGEASADVGTVLSNYPDGNAVSDWARTAVAWAAQNNVVGGNGVLNPAGNANRAEMAQIIMNMSNGNVLAKITDISIAKLPTKTEYYVGDRLDTEGLELKASYDNGSVERITDGFIVSEFDSSLTGTQSVTVAYKGKKVSFNVSVSTPEIKLSKNDIYFNTVSGSETVTAVTTPDGQEIIWTSSAPDVVSVSNGVITAVSIGTATVTAKLIYNGIEYTDMCFVTVNAPKASSIQIVSKPIKTNYLIGDELDLTGLKIKVIYDDDTTETLSSGFAVSGFDSSKTGTQTIAVRYADKQTTFEVVLSKPTGRNINFVDVTENDWYYNAVKFNIERGYFSGKSNTYFGAAENIQKQDFIVVLANIAGVDLSRYEGRTGWFTDVPTRQYYSAPIAWAEENNIIRGNGDGTFGVGEYITREEMCSAFYNYVKNCSKKDVSLSSSVELTLLDYPDGGNVSYWAKTAVAWAAQNGIVGGNGTLNPAGNANRAEMAQIIMNMSNNNIL